MESEEVIQTYQRKAAAQAMLYKHIDRDTQIRRETKRERRKERESQRERDV